MSVCCSCLSMVFPYIGNFKYPHRGTDQEQHFSKNPSERSRKGKIALQFTERPLATVVTLCFRWPLREVFIPYVWFLVSASLKVRPCTEQDKYVSQDSCCFFRAFSLLSPERSFLTCLTVFAGVQDVVHPVFHVSIKWEAALLVYHFAVGQRLVLAFLLICISVI